MPNQSDPNSNNNNLSPNLGGNPAPSEPVFLDPAVSASPVSEPQNVTPVADTTRPSFLTVEENAAPVAAAPVNVSDPTSPFTTETPTVSETQPVAESFVVSPPSGGNNSGNTKKVAALMGIIGLVAATIIGVAAVGSNRLQQSSAWDCEQYAFNVTRSGAVSVMNGSTRNEPIQKAQVKINGSLVQTFDVPALSPGQSATLGNVTIPGGTFTWEVIGTVDCQDGGSYQASPTPTVSPSPTPTATPSGSPSPTPSSSPSGTPNSTISCSAIKAFNENWQALSASQLSALKPGAKVRFTASGNATSGTFDKARFTINGTQRPEVTQKRPNTLEFYDEYTISASATTVNVSAQVHHVQTNQWY